MCERNHSVNKSQLITHAKNVMNPTYGNREPARVPNIVTVNLTSERVKYENWDIEYTTPRISEWKNSANDEIDWSHPKDKHATMFLFCNSSKKITGDVRFSHLTCSYLRQKGVRNWYSKYKPKYKEHTHTPTHRENEIESKCDMQTVCSPPENKHNGEWCFRVYANFSTNTIISLERI